jgi:flagellin-like hook-associated protein FlgL
MTRIGTLGANTSYINRMLDIQNRMSDEQVSVSTGLKSQTYTGISSDVNTLLNFETEKANAQQFVDGNKAVGTKLDAAANSLSGIQQSIKTFRDQMNVFNQGNTTSQKNVEQIQNFAYQAMLDMQSYLSANVNGQYLFSGGRVSTDPMNMPASTLSGFQALYDGTNQTWPTTRAAQLLDTHFTALDTTSLSFDPNTGTINAADADSLSSVASGTVFAVGNSVSNNKSFQVKSHAAMNVNGAPLAETNGTGSGSPTVTYGATPTQVLPAATGDLDFAFLPNGNMSVTPLLANSLAALSVGTTFTVNGSTGANWDGAYKVVANTNGVLEIATDTAQAKSESINQTGSTAPLSLAQNYGPSLPLTTGTVTMTATPSAATGKTSVTITTAGADLGSFVAGDKISIGGSADHNGTFTVTAATANSVTFDINSDALRVSKFLPQSGRTDVTMTFDVGTGVAAGNVSAAQYGSLTFTPTGTTGERISGTNGASSFTDASGNPYPPVGQVITLKSTSGVNDGVYKVTANSGTDIEVESVPMTAETVSTADITTSSWYKGDTLQVQHRIDQDRQVNVGIYASDTAFEKAIRAMGIIAQGTYGTAGGLDKNQKRISQALYLLNDSLESPASGTPPFGAEQRGDMNSVQQNLGFTQQVISQKNDKHNNFINFLDTRISDIEQVDKTTAVTSLLNDSNALQASYQSLAKVQSLSLLNYVK